jgi:hypothetical protein
LQLALRPAEGHGAGLQDIPSPGCFDKHHLKVLFAVVLESPRIVGSFWLTKSILSLDRRDISIGFELRCVKWEKGPNEDALSTYVLNQDDFEMSFSSKEAICRNRATVLEERGNSSGGAREPFVALCFAMQV